MALSHNQLSMSSPTTQLDQIKIKVEKLIMLHDKLYEQNAQLEHEKIMLEEKLHVQNRIINELKEKDKITNLASAINTNNQDSREVKKKISNYIKEIDRCLAMLNK